MGYPDFWTQAQIDQYEKSVASAKAEGYTIPAPWWEANPEWANPEVPLNIVDKEEITKAAPDPIPQSYIAEGIDKGAFVSADPAIKTGDQYLEAIAQTPEIQEKKSELAIAGFDPMAIADYLGIAWNLLTGDVVGAVVQGADIAIDKYSSSYLAEHPELTNENNIGSEQDMTTGLVTGSTVVDGVPFGGPGAPEPPSALVSKMWKTKSFSNTAGEYWVYHWLLIDGRRMSYNAAKKQVKVWRPKKNITLGPKPRVKDLIRINKSVNRLNTGLKKQLKKAKVDL